MKDQALDIIDKSKLLFLATTDEDGNPRSSIVLSRVTDDGEIAWPSSPDTVHSRNIARDSRVGISAYYEDTEINEFRAVYISTRARDTGSNSPDDEALDAKHEYVVGLGEYDEAQSKPNRLYFKESE